MSEEFESPRIFALADSIAAGDQSALEAFWRDVASSGTPLVETHPTDTGRVLLTFIWRGDETTTGVTIRGGHASFGNPPLHHLTDTDVWYRTFESGPDARTAYQLFHNPPEVVTPKDNLALTEHPGWITDPLNLRAFGLGAPAPPQSVIELPQAPLQPWVEPRDGISHGTIDHFTWNSATLGNERRVWIYTPSGHDAARAPYPLAVFFDGWAFRRMGIQHTLDNLIAAGEIPPIVVALVHQLDRLTELPCNEQFARAIAGELCGSELPRYNITDDPAHTAVGGMSYGAIAAAFHGLRFPDRFGNIISQSGSYWWGPGVELPARLNQPGVSWEWLIDQYEASAPLPLRWYMDVGLLERGTRAGVDVDMLNTNRRMRDVLQEKGYDIDYHEYNGGHDYICWRGTIADALITAFGARRRRGSPA